MESATLTRLRAGSHVRAVPVSTWAKLAFVALCAMALVGFLIYPTYPTYDSEYALIWGREILHGHKPSFAGYRHPTEHPLAVAFGAALSLLGEGGGRVLIFCAIGSFVALVAGLYRLARLSFGALAGAIAAVLLLTRFDFASLAIRGYLDLTYLALVVWAGALELARPRRGPVVFALLVAASWLRPEGWILLGAYFLWCWPGASWRRRALAAAFVVAGPLPWALLDAWATGDPMYSLTSTSGLAEELGRAKGLSAVPSATQDFLLSLDKAPVLLAGIAGAVLAVWIAPRKVWMPAVLFLSGLGTFVAVGVAGLSVIERYLLVPSLMVMVFAAVAVGGFGMLRPGSRSRRGWAAIAAVVVAASVVWTAVHVNTTKLTGELRLRGRAHESLDALLRQPAVRRALPCGPVAVPTHKLVPDVRWILGRSEGGVEARSNPRSKPTRGVTILVTDPAALSLLVFVDSTVKPRWNLPPAGSRRIGVSRYYAAYAVC